MDNFSRFLDQVYSCVPYVLLAMAGSAIRWLNRGLSGGLWGLFVSNLTAGFIALLCGLSAEFLHLESGGVFFLSGMAGFMGGTWVLERFAPFYAPLSSRYGEAEFSHSPEEPVEGAPSRASRRASSSEEVADEAFRRSFTGNGQKERD